MKKSLMLVLGALAVLLTAPSAFAADGHLNIGTVTNLADDIMLILNTVVMPFIFAIAFIVFLWNVYRYFIVGGADEEKRTEGRKFVLWSVIGFAIMVSIWGLVNLVVSTFGFGSATRPCLPTFTGPCKQATGSTGAHTSGTPIDTSTYDPATDPNFFQ